MSFVKVNEAVREMPKRSGVTAGIRPLSEDAPALFLVVININAEAQARLFARPVDIERDRFTIERGTGPDCGLIRIEKRHDGDFKPMRFIRGAVRFHLHAWASVPRQKRRAAACLFVDKVGMQATLALPWKGENQK